MTKDNDNLTHEGLAPPVELGTQCTCGILFLKASAWEKHSVNCEPFMKWRLLHRQHRLEKLKELHAPQQIIDKEHELIAEAKLSLEKASQC